MVPLIEHHCLVHVNAQVLMLKLTFCTLISKKSNSYRKKAQYPLLLDGNIGKMNKHIVQFIHTGIIFHCTEPGKS